MPNTQTSVPLYAQGEVLTAANLNLTNSGVPVFATTVTRDAAFGGANEKVLAEGQFAYIEATNATQYYDGAAWQSVGASGLTLITTVSFSAQTTISMAAGVFTSTYDTYMVMWDCTTSVADERLGLRVNSAGSPRTAGNYFGAGNQLTYLGANNIVSDNAATSLNFAANRDRQAFTIFVHRPTSSQPTIISYTGFGAGGTAGGGGAAQEAYCDYGGQYGVSEANDGLTFIRRTGTGTITGNYQVYGLAKS